MGDGYVGRETVIKVLQRCGVAVSEHGSKDMFILEKGDTVIVEVLGPTVNRQMIHHLSWKFNVPIHYFYNPNVIFLKNTSS